MCSPRQLVEFRSSIHLHRACADRAAHNDNWQASLVHNTARFEFKLNSKFEFREQAGAFLLTQSLLQVIRFVMMELSKKLQLAAGE